MNPGPESPFVEDYRRAAKFIGEDKIRQAESIYDDLAKKEPHSPAPYVGLGSCQLRWSNFASARELYQKALELDPLSIAAHVGIGSSYSLESNYTKAITNYAKALAVDQNCPQAEYGLALAYSQLGDKPKAQRHLQRFKQLFPQSRYIKDIEHWLEWTSGATPLQPIVSTPTNN